MIGPIFLVDESATLNLACQFSGCLKKFRLPESGLTVDLNGDLGAGKTSFVRGLLHSLGFSGSVKSPTYSLLEEYRLSADLIIQHFDLYRFSTPEEWIDAGFDDLAPHAIRLIEWADKGGDYPPPPDIDLNLYVENTGRMACFSAHTATGEDFLSLWQT